MKLLLVLLALIPISYGCFSSGVCGGGCAPPPIPPVCRGGCGGGYGCGQYGCYRMRARARSAKTLSLVAGLGSKARTPDERFMECCQERNLPDSCLGKCSYRSYTRSALQAMYFKQDSCPMQAAADIHFCAAQGRDHTSCCVRNGVSTTLAGPKCLTFCDQRPGNVTQLDFTYLACYDRFENMKTCFWQDTQSRLPEPEGHSEPSFSQDHHFGQSEPVEQQFLQPEPSFGSQFRQRMVQEPRFAFSEDTETVDVVAPAPTRPPKRAKTFN